jgi:hypothetical protein
VKHPSLRTAVAATLSAGAVACTLVMATSAQAVAVTINCASVTAYGTDAYGTNCTVIGTLTATSLAYLKYNGQVEYLCNSWTWSASVAPVPNPTYYVSGGGCRAE